VQKGSVAKQQVLIA